MSKKDETVATQKLFDLLDEFIEAKRTELSSNSAEEERQIGSPA
ncbi:MAG: hypothetical protein AAF335_02075 [Bacteroidota bacterium]